MAEANLLVPEDPDVLLTLTPEETRFVRSIMQLIGGDEVRSRRRHCAAIDQALAKAGVKYHGSSSVRAAGYEGGITCAQ